MCQLREHHDPQVGTVSREALPDLFKSLRCELVTFYEANKWRSILYNKNRVHEPELAAAKYSYFDIDDDLYGLFYLDLKIVDTLSLPASNTSIDDKTTVSSTTSRTWHVGPTGGLTDTYELNWSFAIRQDSRFNTHDGDLYPLPDGVPYPKSLQCYREVPRSPDGALDDLAAGKRPDLELFKRIAVNGKTSLAYWLIQNGEVMFAAMTTSRTDVTRKNLDDRDIFAGQMVYTFMVQVSGGLDAKFSLLTNVWNPLAADVSGSIATTNNLVFYLNGSKSNMANNAKVGNALIRPAPVKPLPVTVVNYETPPPPPSPPDKGKGGKRFRYNRVDEPVPPGTLVIPAPAPQRKTVEPAPARDRGYLLGPSAVTPIVP